MVIFQRDLLFLINKKRRKTEIFMFSGRHRQYSKDLSGVPSQTYQVAIASFIVNCSVRVCVCMYVYVCMCVHVDFLICFSTRNGE